MKNKKSTIIIILLSLLLVGGFLRLYKLGSPSLWIDEGFTIMQTKAIAQHGYPLLSSGQVEKKDLLLPYIYQIFSSEQQKNVFLLRLIPVFFGIISILLLFFIGLEVFGWQVGLISSTLFTFSYWHIAWSRQTRGYSLLVFFLLLFVFWLVKHNKTKKWKFLPLAFLAAILATLAKNIGVILVLNFFLYLIFEKRYKTAIATIAISILGIVLTDPGYLFIFIPKYNYFGYYLFGYLWQYFGFFVIMFLVGLYLCLKNKKEEKNIFLLVLTINFSAISLLSFFYYVNQCRYLFFITPLFFVFSAYFFFYLYKIARTKAMLFIVFVLIIDALVFESLVFWPRDFYKLEEYTPQPNFKAAYEELGKHLRSDDLIVSSYPYMDQIYLGRTDRAIAMSYTNKKGDNSIVSGKEYYSGTEKVKGREDLEAMRSRNNIYIIIDQMAMGRISESVWNYIQTDGVIIFHTNDENKQNIFVYQLPKTN